MKSGLRLEVNTLCFSLCTSSTLSASHCVSRSCSLHPPHPSSHPSFLLSLFLVLPILPPVSSLVSLRHSPCPDHWVLVSRWRMQARTGKVGFLWFMLTAAVWTESRGPVACRPLHPARQAPLPPPSRKPHSLGDWGVCVARPPSPTPLPAPPGSHAPPRCSKDLFAY